jgi:Rrf2 family protein
VKLVDKESEWKKVIYSKTCEYAIRSLIFFAEHPEKKSATVKEVSKETGVPQAYVAKIFQCLVRSRILYSQRGSRGGYAPFIPASKLTLLKVVESLDDVSKSPFSNCIMGLQKCNNINPCPLHDIWAKAKEQMMKKLSSSTILDVSKLGDKFRQGKQRRHFLSKHMRSIFTT